MKLYGRSYPDPKSLQWWSTLRVMDPMGVKGRRGSKVHGFKRSNKSKVSANFKGSRASGLFLRGSWLQGYNISKHSKVSMALERQVSKVKRSRVNYEVLDINS